MILDKLTDVLLLSPKSVRLKLPEPLIVFELTLEAFAVIGMELTTIYTSSDDCFEKLTDINEDIGLTPCYDLSAAYCAITYLFDLEKYEDVFESVDLDNVAVKHKYNNTSFVEMCI